jgi:hypothetical protein
MSDEFKRHIASGNRTGHQGVHDHDAPNRQERTQHLKYAIFYLFVAALLFLANELAKYPRPNANQPDSPVNVALDLSVGRTSQSARARNYPTEMTTYVIRFRLTNRGNHSAFFAIDRDTARPLGHIVYRVAPGSEWMALSRLEKRTSTSAQPSAQDGVAWAELPPGGWVDGVYDDPGLPGGDHAYELDLKAANNDKVIRLISQAYRVNAN